jgi:hypothetical protein
MGLCGSVLTGECDGAPDEVQGPQLGVAGSALHGQSRGGVLGLVNQKPRSR